MGIPYIHTHVENSTEFVLGENMSNGGFLLAEELVGTIDLEGVLLEEASVEVGLEDTEKSIMEVLGGSGIP
jgi:hypothetical protein